LRPVEFYKKAKRAVIKEGYKQEFIHYETLSLNNITPDDFFDAYLHVVINSGMKYQVAEKIKERAYREGFETIGHVGKRNAILKMIKGKNAEKCLKELKEKKTIIEKLDHLESLPYIGKITKYHLAKNLGIDIAKPDRHLVRLAKKFGFNNVQKFCNEISKETGDKITVIDVILWRYSNLFGSK